jgi:hypothetical protein
MTLALTRPLPLERGRLLPRFEHTMDRGRVSASVMGPAGRVDPLTVRLGPGGTAWDRINFFLRSFQKGKPPSLPRRLLSGRRWD